MNHISAAELHKDVPPDWYYRSIKKNIFQRYWHYRRFKQIASLIEKNKKATILDIGSADGVFTKVILDASGAKKIVGIDVLKSSVDWANKHWRRNKKMKFKVEDAHKLDFPSNSFDAVFALEVMEHVYDPSIVFKEIRRVLKKDGYAVVLVPSDNFLFLIIWGFITRFWWARIWRDCHVQSFSQENSLAEVVAKSGLKVEVDKKFILRMLDVVKARKVK
jgi:ubiquinone/menaquinone biosynthesis C-methylase UbiE